MNKNTVLRELAQKKYNVIESHIVRVDDTFTITSNDGEVYTEQDFTAQQPKKQQPRLNLQHSDSHQTT
jgi:hypothetical protein